MQAGAKGLAESDTYRAASYELALCMSRLLNEEYLQRSDKINTHVKPDYSMRTRVNP